jgi:hypothetical protein
MKTIALVLAILASACVSSARLDTLERQNQELAEQNRRLRQANARGYQPPGAPKLPSERPVPPAVVGNPVMGAGGAASVGGAPGATGVMWARQQHGVYMGTVGGQSRQVTQGRKIHLDNQVCDGGARNVWSQCWDSDENGAPDLNTWLAFQIDGKPVVCDSGFVHPDTGESLLQPGQSCFVELGASRTVKLTIRAYRNNGTATYVMLDATPYATSLRKVSVGNMNVAYYGVDESRF